MYSMTRARLLAVLFPVVIAASTALGQGPTCRNEIIQINLHRTRIVSPAGRLYGLAVKRCGDADVETELVEKLAWLAGSAYTFSIVVIEPGLYLSDRRFKNRIDSAFYRLQAAVTGIEVLKDRVPREVWRQLAPRWIAFKRAYDTLAPCWTGEKPTRGRPQAIELKASDSSARVGDPVQLEVFIRYRNGLVEPVDSPDVSWLVRPDRGITINSSFQFIAERPGVYQVTAVYRELTTPAVVIRVKRLPRNTYQRDLTGVFLGHKQNFAVVKSVACKVPDEPFDALRIRILDHAARIGDLTVYFADGSTAVLWKNRREVLEPGNYFIGTFPRTQRILRFDLRTQGEGGFYSKQTLLGVRRRR
jgi:hypothetical protein